MLEDTLILETLGIPYGGKNIVGVGSEFMYVFSRGTDAEFKCSLFCVCIKGSKYMCRYPVIGNQIQRP